MSSQYKILIADAPWSIEPEREVFGQIGAEIIVAETKTEEELLTLAPQVDGILTDRQSITGDIIAVAQRCKAIARYGVGFDNVALKEATASGIVVTNVPAYCIDEVTDHAMALLLACARKIPLFHKHINSWNRDVGPPMRRIRGQTLGVIGFGRIGQAIAPKAQAFGLEVIVFDQYLTSEAVQAHGAIKVELPELLAKSDYISIHTPLTPETEGLIGEAELRQMKPNAYLINTARGGIIDIVALHKALSAGWIAGAGQDVLPQEPAPPDEPLLSLENVIFTPHVAFLSVESTYDAQKTAASEVARVLTGQMPESVVNPEVLDSAALRAKALAGR